jgi:hypothetical protein
MDTDMKLTREERYAIEKWMGGNYMLNTQFDVYSNHEPAAVFGALTALSPEIGVTRVTVNLALIRKFIDVQMEDKRRLQESLRIAAAHMQNYDPFYSRWMEQEASSQSVELPPNPEPGTRNTEP